MQLVLGLSVGLVLFLCSVLSFIWGCKVGKALSNGNVPTININPIEAVKKHIEAKEEKKQADIVAQGWENIFSYDGTPQKEVEE